MLRINVKFVIIQIILVYNHLSEVKRLLIYKKNHVIDCAT